MERLMEEESRFLTENFVIETNDPGSVSHLLLCLSVFFIKNCGVNWRVILTFYLLRMSRLIYNKRQKGRGVLGASLIFVSPAQRALSWGVFRKFSKGNVLERQEGQSKEFCVWHERFLSPQFSSYKSVPVVSLVSCKVFALQDCGVEWGGVRCGSSTQLYSALLSSTTHLSDCSVSGRPGQDGVY